MKFFFRKEQLLRIFIGGICMSAANILMEIIEKGDMNQTIREEVRRQLHEELETEDENEEEET